MRRIVSLLLTVILALASVASATHAVPTGADGDGPMPSGLHAAMPDAATTSCCEDDRQRTASSCHVMAALPTGDADSAPARMAVALAFAFGETLHDGLDPERLLDPPRA